MAVTEGDGPWAGGDRGRGDGPWTDGDRGEGWEVKFDILATFTMLPMHFVSTRIGRTWKGPSKS